MNKNILIVIIFVIAALLRLVGLESFPPGVTADEIQQGYTSYSLLKTGKDEWGDVLPINPRGFGDYKPPLYSYLSIPFIAVFGLNITAVRLVSALAGVLTIIITYYLAKKIFASQEIALLSTLFFALSYWHIYYSRLGWESNVGLLLFLSGLFYFLKSFQKNIYLFVSSVLYGLTLFSYHSFKVQTMLFVFVLCTLFYKKLKNYSKKWLVLSCLVLILSVCLLLWGIIYSGGGRRATDAAFYQEKNLTGLRIKQVEDKLPDPFNRIINNRIDYVITKFTENYFMYLSPNFLISPSRSDSSVFNMPGTWLIDLWQFGFFIFGLLYLFKFKHEYAYIIIAWILISPVPAALSKELMQTQRVELFLAVIPFMSAFGLYHFMKLTTNKKIKKIVLAFILITGVWSTLKFTDYYLFHVFNQKLGGIKYGYKEVIEYVDKHKDQYDTILFTKKHSEPHIFIAFYTKMEPSEFQSYSKNWKSFEKDYAFLDMMDYSMGKYHFKNVSWRTDLGYENSLIVATPEELLPNTKSRFAIKGSNGEDIFLVVDPKDLK